MNDLFYTLFLLRLSGIRAIKFSCFKPVVTQENTSDGHCKEREEHGAY
jgi:hypothetical protein